MFLDLIENDDDAVYLLKSIDLRLRMFREASTNYTIVMAQWLAVRDPTYECLSKYITAIKTTADAVHALWAYASAKSSGQDSQKVFEKLDAFRNLCANNACKNATDILVSGLNGGSNQIFRCDLIDVLYQGLPGQKLLYVQQFEKGYRDMVTPYLGYLLTHAATSLVVFSAYESL